MTDGTLPTFIQPVFTGLSESENSGVCIETMQPLQIVNVRQLPLPVTQNNSIPDSGEISVQPVINLPQNDPVSQIDQSTVVNTNISSMPVPVAVTPVVDIPVPGVVDDAISRVSIVQPSVGNNNNESEEEQPNNDESPQSVTVQHYLITKVIANTPSGPKVQAESAVQLFPSSDYQPVAQPPMTSLPVGNIMIVTDGNKQSDSVPMIPITQNESIGMNSNVPRNPEQNKHDGEENEDNQVPVTVVQESLSYSNDINNAKDHPLNPEIVNTPKMKRNDNNENILAFFNG